MRTNGFINYLLDFYGPGGIYTKPRDPFHRPMTREEAARAAAELSQEAAFEGDSIDREDAAARVLVWRADQPEASEVR